jgi:hypothetical protein
VCALRGEAEAAREMVSNAAIAMNAICSPTLMPFAPEMLAQICKEKAYGLLTIRKKIKKLKSNSRGRS